jgi:hypothetical protein
MIWDFFDKHVVISQDQIENRIKKFVKENGNNVSVVSPTLTPPHQLHSRSISLGGVSHNPTLFQGVQSGRGNGPRSSIIDNTGYLKKIVDADVDITKVASGLQGMVGSKEDNTKLLLSQKHVNNQNTFFQDIKQYESSLPNTQRRAFKEE